MELVYGAASLEGHRLLTRQTQLASIVMLSLESDEKGYSAEKLVLNSTFGPHAVTSRNETKISATMEHCSLKNMFIIPSLI
jgi:hypothetical protein